DTGRILFISQVILHRPPRSEKVISASCGRSGTHSLPLGPAWDFTTGNRHFRSSGENSCDKPAKITSHALFPSYASAVGQRSFPRPMRKASTSLVLPGNRPEKRLGFGSTADFLNAATLW